MKSTNYYNTLIQVAEDCPLLVAEKPPQKKTKTAAEIQFELIKNNPYKYSSDEIIFSVFAEKNNIGIDRLQCEWAKFFSKGQPCLRCSPLAKRYGWGIHFNSDGSAALYPKESEDYNKIKNDVNVKKIIAMRLNK